MRRAIRLIDLNFCFIKPEICVDIGCQKKRCQLVTELNLIRFLFHNSRSAAHEDDDESSEEIISRRRNEQPLFFPKVQTKNN